MARVLAPRNHLQPTPLSKKRYHNTITMLTKQLALLSHHAASRCSRRQLSVLSLSTTTTVSSQNNGGLLRTGFQPTQDVSTSSSSIAIGTSIHHSRSFSSMGMMPRRGFPQYTVFGPDSALSVRAVLPHFKRAGNDGVSVDRRGKLVFEFVPRNASGAGFAWTDKTNFSLSVEEVGLLLSQLPGNGVELSHSMNYGVGSDADESGARGVTQYSGDLVEKVLTIQPGEGSTLNLKIDYVKDGVGGQSHPQYEETTPVS